MLFRSKVGSAARDAVRGASLARTFADAQANAQSAAQSDLAGVCSGGGQGTPTTKVQLFENGAPVGAGDFAVAQDIEVTVSCVANLAAFHVIGFPVSQTFGDTAAAPLDPFEDRGSGCAYESWPASSATAPATAARCRSGW